MADRGTKRSHPGSTNNHNKYQKKDPNRSKYRAQAASSSSRSNISQNAIQADDVGLFITSDKGKEKAALREIEDLLESYLDAAESDQTGDEVKERQTAKEGGEGLTTVPDAAEGFQQSATYDETNNPNHGLTAAANTRTTSIEDSIAAEIASLKSHPRITTTTTTNTTTSTPPTLQTPTTAPTKLSLITLDIPCVSFVRFPPTSTLDPVSTVLAILRDAATNPNRQRSRFIKRLTPITKVKKVLNNGLDEICREVLPGHFAIEAQAVIQSNGPVVTVTKEEDASEQEAGAPSSSKADSKPPPPPLPPSKPPPIKYRIDLSRRQSDHLARDHIITTIATHVSGLTTPPNLHPVDLQKWDKCILVEVYRGIVGMSVIDTGYEEWEGRLKRGNLAEVYAAARLREDDDHDHDQKGKERKGKERKG